MRVPLRLESIQLPPGSQPGMQTLWLICCLSGFTPLGCVIYCLSPDCYSQKRVSDHKMKAWLCCESCRHSTLLPAFWFFFIRVYNRNLDVSTASGWIHGDSLGKGREKRACRVSSVDQNKWDVHSIFISLGQ